jgi:hypothetical protein
MLKLIDFDLDISNLNQYEVIGVNTLERRGYHYGWLQGVTAFKGLTMDDIPAYVVQDKSGLHTLDDLINYSNSDGIGVIIKDENGTPTGILYGIDAEQCDALGLW